MSRAATTPAAVRTCARILDGALELFNRDGTSAVTTNRIATHISMSPGNLYYWFSDKDEIIRALFARFTAEHATLWDGPHHEGPPTTPEALYERLAVTSQLSATYRFLARDLLGLVHADTALRRAYVETRRRRLAAFGALARAWRAEGIVREVSDERLDRVLEALWIVAETWWSFAELDLTTAGGPDARGGERLLRAVLEPLLVDAP